MSTVNESIKNNKEEFKSILFVVILAMLVRTFIIELFFVPTGSMKATILEGDYLFSTKYSYGFSNYSIPFSPNLMSGRVFASMPERGDIIIMRPPHDMNTRYIKRLIGLPGDKIEIINDVTYINDQPVTRTEVGKYIDEKGMEFIKFREILPSGKTYFSYKISGLNELFRHELSHFGPKIVPKDHFFFMGDNRDDSGDSRAQLGFVPFVNLIAKAQFVFFSTKIQLWDGQASFTKQIGRFWPWISSIRFNRLFTNLYINDISGSSGE